jgi:membrane protein
LSDRLKRAGKLLVERFQEHDVAGLGAELAYRFLFAIFPFGLFVAALAGFVAGWIGIDNPTDNILAALGDNLPAGIAEVIRPELERVIGSTQPGLLSIGALGALWAATGGINAMMKGMNRAFDVEESRSFPLKLAVAIGLTILGAAGVIGAFVTVVGGALVTQELAEQLGLAGQAWSLIQLLRWPFVVVLLIVAVGILYRFAPNVRASWRWVFAGAAVFTIGWLIATVGFAIYLANFANYGATYGTLGGVIALMLWFYITAVILVTGAEFVAVGMAIFEPERVERRREEVRAAKLKIADLKPRQAPIPAERALVPTGEVWPPAARRDRPGQDPVQLVPVVLGLGALGLAVVLEVVDRFRTRN